MIRQEIDDQPALLTIDQKSIAHQRLTFVDKAFAELGFEGDELEMRTRVFIGFLSGERQIFGPNRKTAQRYRELRATALPCLTTSGAR